MKKVFLYIVFLFFLSCGEKLPIPEEYKLKEVSVQYADTYEIKIYNFENQKLPSLNELNKFPKKKFYDKKYQFAKWHRINSGSETYTYFLKELNSLISSANVDDELLILNIKNKLDRKDERIFISGLYENFKANEKDFFNRYYYIYLIDVTEKKLVSFELISL